MVEQQQRGSSSSSRNKNDNINRSFDRHYQEQSDNRRMVSSSSNYDRNDSSYHRQQQQHHHHHQHNNGGYGTSSSYSRRDRNSSDYHRSDSNDYHNRRTRNDHYNNEEGNYKNYDNKPVSMKQSHHNNSSSSFDSFKYKENYNRKGDAIRISEQEQSIKRKTVDNSNSSSSSSNEQAKRVKIEEKAPSIVNEASSSNANDERLQQQLNNETLLLQNNDEEQVAAKREERRKRFKQMEELIASELTQSDNNNTDNVEINENSDEDEIVEPIKEYNVNDERALFIHQIEKQREKESNPNPIEVSECKVTPLYEENENSESPIIDMFSDSPDTLVKLLNTNTINLNNNNNSTELYDDVEGYYRYTIGEVINQRYKIEQFLGQGVFSCVVKAIDLNNTQPTSSVAIKIIRSNESMKKAGLKELDLLAKINEKDTREYNNIIKMMESFTYRNHLCIVFELLEMNLRDVLKNYGKVQGHQHSVGISIQACKIYTKQLINALKYIQECNIIHADIKPDNILLDHSHQFVKLSDFGSACHVSENIITPYLVSRFYRAPEIILGMKYSYPIDMWSIACTIYELYTGKILFTSQNNNDHLRLVMELKGKFPNRVLKKCAFRENHFESGGAFLFREFDKLTKKIKVSKVYFQRNTRDLKAMLLNSMLQNHQHDENGSEQSLIEEKKQVILLHDFLDKALALDPSKRLSVNDALQHPFINN